MIFSPLTKGLAILSLLLTLTSALSVWGYLGIRDKLTLLQSIHRQLEQDYKECGESKDKLLISSEQDDATILHKIQEIDRIKSETDTKISKLNKIPVKTCPKQVGVENEVPEYVDIDLPFSPEFVLVFKREKGKGSSNTSTR